MGERTIEDALAHGDEYRQSQAAWAIYFRETPEIEILVRDIVLLADDEVIRLRDNAIPFDEHIGYCE